MNVILKPLEEHDREQFILDNQKAFRYATLAKMSKVRLKQLLTDGKITRQQYDKAAKSS